MRRRPPFYLISAGAASRLFKGAFLAAIAGITETFVDRQAQMDGEEESIVDVRTSRTFRHVTSCGIC